MKKHILILGASIGFAMGLAIFGGLMWLIWEESAAPQNPAITMSLLSLFLSVIAGALFRERFLRFLKMRHGKNSLRDRR
jgi:hypothetical protein